MNKTIIIKDGTSKAQLMKTIANFEKEYRVDVLKIEVNEEHDYKLIEFDGIIIAEWQGNIDDFINGTEISKMQFINCLS